MYNGYTIFSHLGLTEKISFHKEGILVLYDRLFLITTIFSDLKVMTDVIISPNMMLTVN